MMAVIVGDDGDKGGVGIGSCSRVGALKGGVHQGSGDISGPGTRTATPAAIYYSADASDTPPLTQLSYAAATLSLFNHLHVHFSLSTCIKAMVK